MIMINCPAGKEEAVSYRERVWEELKGDVFPVGLQIGEENWEREIRQENKWI